MNFPSFPLLSLPSEDTARWERQRFAQFLLDQDYGDGAGGENNIRPQIDTFLGPERAASRDRSADLLGHTGQRLLSAGLGRRCIVAATNHLNSLLGAQTLLGQLSQAHLHLLKLIVSFQ